jgi:hypothetical protein
VQELTNLRGTALITQSIGQVLQSIVAMPSAYRIWQPLDCMHMSPETIKWLHLYRSTYHTCSKTEYWSMQVSLLYH